MSHSLGNIPVIINFTNLCLYDSTIITFSYCYIACTCLTSLSASMYNMYAELCIDFDSSLLDFSMTKLKCELLALTKGLGGGGGGGVSQFAGFGMDH